MPGFWDYLRDDAGRKNEAANTLYERQLNIAKMLSDNAVTAQTGLLNLAQLQSDIEKNKAEMWNWGAEREHDKWARNLDADTRRWTTKYSSDSSLTGTREQVAGNIRGIILENELEEEDYGGLNWAERNEILPLLRARGDLKGIQALLNNAKKRQLGGGDTSSTPTIVPQAPRSVWYSGGSDGVSVNTETGEIKGPASAYLILPNGRAVTAQEFSRMIKSNVNWRK